MDSWYGCLDADAGRTPGSDPIESLFYEKKNIKYNKFEIYITLHAKIMDCLLKLVWNRCLD